MILLYRHIVSLALVVTLVFVGTVEGQEKDAAHRPLTLDEAIAEALARNGDLEAARARTDAVRAQATSASGFLYPGLQLEAGSVRSDDPVAVFGTKLRQERFSQADFGIDALNRPDPVTDWTAGAGASWRILDPSAWAGRSAARLGARASELELDRRREATVFQTRVLYLQALAAQARVTAAEESLEAARVTREVVGQRESEGILTEADVLQADAEVAGARARFADARRARFEARSRLGVHVGWSGDTLPRPTDDLLGESALDAPTADPVAPSDLRRRSDLRAMERISDAAGARVDQAVRSRLPVIETFGRVSTHAPHLSGDRSANWSVGLQLTWPLFTGFAREGSIDRARALARAAEAEREQRFRDARAEMEEARQTVDAAREGALAAEAAARAAREAQRLVRRRFEEGLTTTAQLLQADARAAEMESRAIGARTSLQIAKARFDFAVGTTPVQP
ncbi:MAG: TolC family protein [Longimicrobiales bacterium]|nr:TolC family protein [Longimicrobiales bacterium]